MRLALLLAAATLVGCSTDVASDRTVSQVVDTTNREASAERRELISHTTRVENIISLLSAKYVGTPHLSFSVSPQPLQQLSVDPSDPNRFYGPSSTCMPEFVFSQQGDTNWRNPYIAGNTLRSSDDPIGMKGSIDRGNWVETRFNLDRYKGRAVRVRLLVSTIKVGDAPDASLASGRGFPDPGRVEIGLLRGPGASPEIVDALERVTRQALRE